MIAFEISKLPKMTNGGHGSHFKVASDRKYWRARVSDELQRFPALPTTAWPFAKARLVRYSSVEPDFDGLVAGFKPIIDALVFYGIIEDDSLSRFKADYQWERVPPKQGKIRVEVWPVTT